MECREGRFCRAVNSNSFFGKEKIVSTVQIYVLQTPQILLDGEQVILPYKKAEALLYYMAIEKKATRDQIAALLWDSCDEATAKKNLRHALYTIRKIFHTDLVSSPTRQTLELNPELTFLVDYDAFMEKRDPSLYREELLGGFYIKNAYPYEEWLTMKRGLAKEAFLRAIYDKMQSEADLSVVERETLFKRYVQEDPLDERVYLRMMEIYEGAHLYYKGIRLYQQLVNLLNTELRVAPSREIRELYRKLLHVWSEEGEKEEEHSGEVCTGRERELQLLQASYRQFLSGSPASVLLSGKSGVGKTYLAERFLEEITGENTVILRAVCLENEQNIVLQPWNTIMMQVNSLLKKQNFALDKKYLQAAELLFPLFDTQDVKEPVLGDTTISYSYRATRNLLIKLFEEIGEQVLVVLFFDNIQFMDETSLEFLSLLIRAKNPNIMALVTSPCIFTQPLRTALKPLLKESCLQEITLFPFTRESVRKILAGRLGEERVSEELLDIVYGETSGNAFYLKTLLDGCGDGRLEASDITPLNQVWEQKMAALQKMTRQVLELISSCQAWADMDACMKILKCDEMEILDAVDELKEQGFIKEQQVSEKVRFFFCHDSIQKFVHTKMSPSKRRVFHRKLAEYIEGLPLYEANRYERLIYHYTLCGDREKALEYRIRALTEYSYRYYELYPLFPAGGKKEVQMDSVLDYCRQLEEELLELSQRNPQKESYLKLHVSLMQATAQYCIPQGYYEEGAQYIEKALKSNVLAGDDPAEKIRCLRFLIYQQTNLWKVEHTEEYLEESLLLAKKNGLQEDYAITCRLYGLYLSMKGRFEEGMEYLVKSLKFFKNAPLKSRIYALNIAACYNYMGEIRRKQRDFEEANRYYRQAVATCDSNHCPCNATFYSNMGRSYLAMGKTRQSEEALYQADSVYEESFTLIGRSITKGYLAVLEAEKGNKAEAVRYLEEAMKSAHQFASPYAKGLLALTEAELLVRFPEDFRDILTEPVEAYKETARRCLEEIPGAYEIQWLEDI